MRARAFVFVSLIALFAAVFGGEAPATQSGVRVPPEVEARADAGESVRVIVGVESSFVPEGRLDGVAAVVGCAFSLRRVLKVDPATAIGGSASAANRDRGS